MGGFPSDTLAEDQDLTIALLRADYKVLYDSTAIGWTEAPATLGDLLKQRFRWAFGTLQCLWKHRLVLSTGNPRGLAWFGMPQAWLLAVWSRMCRPMPFFEPPICKPREETGRAPPASLRPSGCRGRTLIHRSAARQRMFRHHG